MDYRLDARAGGERQGFNGVRFLGFAVILALFCGCASSSIETRRADRAKAYAALSLEARAQVDRGEIAQGMGMDAVFIAWGKPSFVGKEKTATGPEVRWSYYRQHTEERVMGAEAIRHPVGPATVDPVVRQVTYPYRWREVVFREGQVAEYRTFDAHVDQMRYPRPPAYRY